MLYQINQFVFRCQDFIAFPFPVSLPWSTFKIIYLLFLLGGSTARRSHTCQSLHSVSARFRLLSAHNTSICDASFQIFIPSIYMEMRMGNSILCELNLSSPLALSCIRSAADFFSPSIRARPRRMNHFRPPQVRISFFCCLNRYWIKHRSDQQVQCVCVWRRTVTRNLRSASRREGISFILWGGVEGEKLGRPSRVAGERRQQIKRQAQRKCFSPFGGRVNHNC